MSIQDLDDLFGEEEARRAALEQQAMEEERAAWEALAPEERERILKAAQARRESYLVRQRELLAEAQLEAENFDDEEDEE